MKLHAFSEKVVSILNRTIDEIEDAKKELLNDPFSDKHYESQEQYERFLEDRGLEDLLIKMKMLVNALQ
ncbi:hypothetical protein [Legionella shakespearei]|uniref:Uncharacterized protein n=1 Tax=Legionella shakespearei DSM 23087 TaxID=1122169 RepID=A0A0W0YLV2_9GAMM|nr:hypothetical protein [Legionella shakespearei]KTD57880.1 hypothetical protein Lsha_2158 [Legionella shakespearei DSM 23087]